jgi:hypothetical protein
MKKSKPDAAAIEVECDSPVAERDILPRGRYPLDGGFIPHPARPVAAKAG